MSGNKFTILSGSKNCYLFNRSTFFKGFPPQSIVTQHFVASKDEYNYETFPVRDDEAGDYLFLDWNDPEAKKVWEPFVKNGTLIEHPKLFQDDDDYEFTEDQEANDRLREEIQERRELFEYYNKQADVSLTDFSRENFSDPIEAFRSLFSNAFVPDEYASTLDEIVHSFISNDIDHPTDTTYSEIATDVAAINLQMLAGTPPQETKLIDQRSYPLAKLVNEQIPPDQSLEQRLLLLNYLSNIQDEARDDMHQITSISNALLLIGQNTIVDSDNPAFDKFCHRYHGSALTILPFFKRYLDHALNSNSFVNAETLKSNAERFGKFFTYSKYVEIMQAKNSPTSPDYHPVSPGKEIEPIIDQEKDPIIKEEEFKIVMVCITNYLFFCFGETFKPRKDYVSNFFRSSIDIKDFFRRFRLRYKYVYFAKPYKLELIKAIDSFVKTYVNEATSFSVVEIFKFDGNPKVAEDFEIIEREV